MDMLLTVNGALPLIVAHRHIRILFVCRTRHVDFIAPKSKTYAYTVNDDDNDADSYINFCPAYFKAPLLKDKVNEMKSAPNNDNYNIDKYHATRGHIWFHELSHWYQGNRRDIFS